ncbi:MAG: hypothetical protein ACQKBY_05730 [Verrucomicrobiales bacterium]
MELSFTHLMAACQAVIAEKSLPADVRPVQQSCQNFLSTAKEPVEAERAQLASYLQSWQTAYPELTKELQQLKAGASEAMGKLDAQLGRLSERLQSLITTNRQTKSLLQAFLAELHDQDSRLQAAAQRLDREMAEKSRRVAAKRQELADFVKKCQDPLWVISQSIERLFTARKALFQELQDLQRDESRYYEEAHAEKRGLEILSHFLADLDFVEQETENSSNALSFLAGKLTEARKSLGSAQKNGESAALVEAYLKTCQQQIEGLRQLAA